MILKRANNSKARAIWNRVEKNSNKSPIWMREKVRKLAVESAINIREGGS